MTIIRISIKIKVPDELSDKELNDIASKYVNVMPTKSFRFVRFSDGLGWLA